MRTISQAQFKITAGTGSRFARRVFGVATILLAAILCLPANFIVHASSANDAGMRVAARLELLGVEPNPTVPRIDLAVQTRRAIVAGDFDTAGGIINDVLDTSELQNWRFYPFDDFFADVVTDAPSEFSDRLDSWVKADPTDSNALLLRAQYSYDRAWAARGHGFVSTVSSEEQARFGDYLRSAFFDTSAALQLPGPNPYTFRLHLRILQGGGPSEQFFGAFAAAIDKFPSYYPLYEVALVTLQPRWDGSSSAMMAFVDEYAGGAPTYSSLKLLYLSLYRQLLSTAEVNCRSSITDQTDGAICIEQQMEGMGANDLKQKVVEALRLYNHIDKYQFGLAIKQILTDMLMTDGADRFSGAVLQLAANAMHSDTQLKPEEANANDYVVDQLVALSWERKGFGDNAVSKYRQAIDAAERAAFPSEVDRHLALAEIYEALADIASDAKQHEDKVVYQQAAVLLGVPWRADRVCSGYYKLEDYDQVVASCTEAIAATDNPHAFYWRGSAYSQLGQEDDALADLKASADLGGYFAHYSAIDMSMIYFGRGDLEGALRVLNAYPYLYDLDASAASQVAVAYNNRCYAYMELGKLNEALEDCTHSLEYGSLPDAFRKQQELVELLGVQ